MTPEQLTRAKDLAAKKRNPTLTNNGQTQRNTTTPATSPRPATTKGTPGKAPTSSKDGGGDPPRQKPNAIDVYYDAEKKTFWATNGKDEWQELTKASLGLILRHNWYSPFEKLTNSLTMVEAKYLEVIQHNSVHYAGRVAGWKPGLHTICGNRVLVTRGPALATPKKGKFPLIKALVGDLFGKQARYFYAWMKHAFASLDKGAPFSPGQMLAIAGPVHCGKSVLQNLITEMLGGRMAKPYRYMSGQTAFNGDLIESEHLMIEDDVEGTDLKTRRHFGAMVKSTCVNKAQSAHAKGRAAFTIEPFWRITMTLNDEPERLMLLPPLDADVRDKIILLRAEQAKWPYPSKDLKDFHAYWDALKLEIPAYLWAMGAWAIPADIKDDRFGVIAYHDPELRERLMSLSPEGKLWQLICESGLLGGSIGQWLGTSIELQKVLIDGDRTGQANDLLYYATACGTYLARLASSMPQCVSSEPIGNNRQLWTITRKD